MDNPILTVAIIVAVTSFFKKQLNLDGWKALLAAFIVSIVIGLTPVVAAQFPVVAPWLTGIVNVVLLFVAAAGSYDLVMDIRTTSKPPTQGL